MNSLKYCPPLRFTRENGEVYPNWEERPLSEYLVEYTEKTLIKNQYPVLTSSRAGLVLQTEHFNGQVTTEDNIGYHVIPYGYFTYRSRSDDGRFAFNRNTLIDKGIVSYFYPVFYVNGAAPYFVWIYLNNFLSRQIVREIVGTSQLVLSFNKLKNLTIKIPSLPEQEKISSFFSLLDQKIEKQQEKIEQLELFKKGIVQKIFSQEIRFEGFTQPWVVKRLDELCSINPKTPNMPERFLYIDLESVEKGRICKELEVVERDAAPSRAQRLLQAGDILYQLVRPYQMNNYHFTEEMSIPTVASTGYAQLRSKISSGFLYQLIHTSFFVKEVLLRCTGSSYPAINSSDLSEIEVKVPVDIQEQIKIASFLSHVDKKINYEVEKLILLESYKKGLLDRMFV